MRLYCPDLKMRFVVPVLFFFSVCSPAIADFQQIGSEFRVNTYTTLGQTNASVAMDASGNFVVVWVSDGQDGDGKEVYAQRYDRLGTPQGVEFRANTYTTGFQQNCSVAMDPNGNFVIAWESQEQDSDGSHGVYGQRYDSSGTPQGDEFQVNTTEGDSQGTPSIAMDADGDFVVTWQSYAQDGDNYGVYGQRYDSSGTKQGTEFPVNTYTTNHQSQSSVAMDANGNFVVAWASDGQDGDGFGVYARRYNSAGGAEGAEFQVNTYTTNNQCFPSVAMDSTGNFVIAWQSDGQDGDMIGVYAQRYDNSGTTQGVEFQVNTHTASHQNGPSLAMDADGNLVIVWMSYNGQDGSGIGIFGQKYDSSGASLGSEFQINSYTTDDQDEPSVAMNANGDVVVAWQSTGQDGDGDGIYAQRYADLDFVTAGSEFQVNTHTADEQKNPSAAMDQNGNFVIAWESYDKDGSGYGVYAQRYDSSGTAQGSEFLVNTSTSNDQRVPQVAMDPNGNFVVVWQSYLQDGDQGGI